MFEDLITLIWETCKKCCTWAVFRVELHMLSEGLMPKLCIPLSRTQTSPQDWVLFQCWCESYSCEVEFTKNRGLSWLRTILNLGVKRNISLGKQQYYVQRHYQADWCYIGICVLGHKFIQKKKKPNDQYYFFFFKWGIMSWFFFFFKQEIGDRQHLN